MRLAAHRACRPSLYSLKTLEKPSREKNWDKRKTWKKCPLIPLMKREPLKSFRERKIIYNDAMSDWARVFWVSLMGLCAIR
jgi:predicted nucleic acid-binding Zn ribbon protein